MSDDVKKAALEEAQRTYKGFISFIKWDVRMIFNDSPKLFLFFVFDFWKNP